MSTESAPDKVGPSTYATLRHAKQVVDGVATLAPVDVRLDGWRTDGLLLGQKSVDDGLRIRAVFGGEDDLDAVAGGKNHGFADAYAPFERAQRAGQRFLAEGEAFAHFHRRGLVAHSRQQQLPI